ncbi:MAG: carbon storage regulator CsrA [Bacillaceae bacterium]|nr:carbon storage regulator CsrA [Bacillaceae bacterium]
MLVLTRKPQQSIMIGDEIEIIIISVNKDQVRIGINAPEHIEIHRKEIYVSIQEENQNAARGENVLDLVQGITRLIKKQSDQ